MDIITTLINQILVMFIIIVLGFFLAKRNFFNDSTLKELSNLMFNVINPLVIINSFVTPYSQDKMKEFILSMILGIGSYLFCILIMKLFFWKKDKHCIERFCVIVSNCGFFGIPIISATLGSDAVFYISPFVAMNSICVLTYASYIITLDKNIISIKKIFKNNTVISFAIGVMLFLLRIQYPLVISSTIKSLGNLLGPTCALMIGTNLANTNFNALKNDTYSFLSIFLRNIFIPFLLILIFRLINNDYFSLKIAVIIAASTPTGASATIFARNYNKDYELAARNVCISTLLSIATIPLLVAFAIKIW